MLLRDRLVEIKNALGDVLKERGLQARVQMEEEEAHIVFRASKAVLSTVRVVFPLPQAEGGQLSWDEASLEYDCYSEVDMAGSGWTKNQCEAVETYPMAGSLEDRLAALRRAVEHSPIVNTDVDQPHVPNSIDLARFYAPLREYLESRGVDPDIVISREGRKSETLHFKDGEDRSFTISFTPWSQRAALSVDGRFIATFPTGWPERIMAAVDTAFQQRDQLCPA